VDPPEAERANPLCNLPLEKGEKLEYAARWVVEAAVSLARGEAFPPPARGGNTKEGSFP